MASRTLKRYRYSLGGAFVLSLVALFFVLRGNGRHGAITSDKVANSDPLSIEPVIPVFELEIDAGEVDALSRRLWPSVHAPFGQVLHALRAFESGFRSPEPDVPTSDDLRAVLLDQRANQEWNNGRMSFVQTRSGTQFVTSQGEDPAAQAHRDQCLSILAELRIPLSESITTRTGAVSVKDVLENAVANYQMKGEIQWTTVAFALYLSPAKQWTNRFGETFTFDQACDELISQPFETSSCGGTHSLYSLAILLRADQMRSILGEPIRRRLKNFLTSVAKAVAGSQDDEGAFPQYWYASIVNERWYRDIVDQVQHDQSKSRAEKATDKLRTWYGAFGKPDSESSQRVQMTGHHVEWMLILPQDMQPATERFQRAAKFLTQELKSAKDEEIQQSYCPFSHAVRYLRLISARNS